MSAAASQRFAEPRFRRLLAIELEDTGHLAAQPTGPLGDQVAVVWIDLAAPDQVTIEVRFASRPVARRSLAIANMRNDVAERLIALATAEMIRSQSRPERPRRPVCPKENNNHEEALPGEARLGLVWSGEAAGVWLPATSTYLAGPGGAVGVLVGPLEPQLFGRWLVGDGDTGTTRWFEAGVAVRHLLIGRPRWRLSLGAAASAALVRMVGARSVGSDTGADDSWTARGAGQLMLEGRVAPNAWLGIALEPGAVLHRVPFETAAGTQGALRGAWLGVSVSLAVEHGLRPDSTPTH